ncbi:Zinc finger MYND domain-containing protein [Ooceraea biroi]|uniref:Zinc finger MYND domain-containing protein n=1 Tax=Ooceraea biroi TaxID=2015173 RepID=A0A026VWF1_OOCBI|nr:Zinc finger MYND domain-containing protein [Ooceraea biroi]
MDDNYNSCFYANACHVCKRFGDGVRLKRCGGCGMIAYCDQRHQKQHWPRHRRLCHAIQEVVRDNGLQVRQVSPQEWAQLKMNLMLLVAIRLPRRLDEYETQMFKFPRACLVCHERSNQLLEDCRLVVHVVAANFIELETARAWEILLHLMSSLALVRLVMIGPELPSEIVSTSVCEDCVRQRKELSFEIHSALYENYVRGSSFVRPDVVAGFNTGIHEREEATYPEETWASSVRALAEQGCPLILSCYTRVEAEKETARINAILGKETKHVYAGINPFAGLRPYRDFETEGIFYQNNYVIVYSNL